MVEQKYTKPGIYLEEVFPTPVAELLTGVPVFVGLLRKAAADAHQDSLSLIPLRDSTGQGGIWLVREPNTSADTSEPALMTHWSQFAARFGKLAPYGYLAAAVRGFFENGGRACYVQIVCFDQGGGATAVLALSAALATLEALDAADLVCAPDIMWTNKLDSSPDMAEVLAMQSALLNHCDLLGDRFAILDSAPNLGAEDILANQRGRLSAINGALSYPWIKVAGLGTSDPIFVPPCGHMAGIYARSDERVGVHKAPANEIVEGALDLQSNLTGAEQGRLNLAGVNCLRVFPGRGIRVWGARTLSGEDRAEWRYVNVRRLFLTVGRWIERNLASTIFEPHDDRLWAQIRRDLTAYCNDLFQRGCLQGRKAEEGFYVKCDAETNPPAVRDLGQVIAEIGLAPILPGEFVVVRIIHSAGGLTMSASAQPW